MTKDSYPGYTEENLRKKQKIYFEEGVGNDVSTPFREEEI